MRSFLRTFIIVFLTGVAVLSAVGYARYEPRMPFVRWTACVLGVNPTMAFGSSAIFTARAIDRGVGDIPVTGYFVSWPGGAAGFWLTPRCGLEANPIANPVFNSAHPTRN